MSYSKTKYVTTIDMSPSKKEFDKVMGMLLQEGFSENGNAKAVMEHCIPNFKCGEFVTHYADGMLIGFTSWRRVLSLKKKMRTAVIEYKWIHPSFRKVGLGQSFAKLLNKEFRKRRVCHIVVEPVTDGGRAMARKLGYLPYKESMYDGNQSHYYSFLKDGRKPIEQPLKSGYSILITYRYKHSGHGEYYSMCYSLDENLNKMPIIAIVSGDADVQLFKDGKEIGGNKVKRFFKDDIEFQYYGLLYLSTPLSKFLIEHGIE